MGMLLPFEIAESLAHLHKALNLAYNFTFLKWGKVGVGRHLWMITPSQGIEILKV